MPKPPWCCPSGSQPSSVTGLWSSPGGSGSSTEHPSHAPCPQRGHGSTVLGSHQGFSLPAGLDFKTLVCLFVAGQPREDGKKKKKIDITLSPMSHCSQLAETPHSSPKMLRKPWGKGRRARGAPRPPALPPDLCPILLLVPTGRDTG